MGTKAEAKVNDDPRRYLLLSFEYTRLFLFVSTNKENEIMTKERNIKYVTEATQQHCFLAQNLDSSMA